jgi:hypothetical protein
MLLADRGYDADWIRELAMKKGARGPTSRRRAIAAIRSASAHISTAPATGLSGSSTGSNNVVGWRRGTTGWPPTTLPSFSSRQSGYGCVFSPRLSSCQGGPMQHREVRFRSSPCHRCRAKGWCPAGHWYLAETELLGGCDADRHLARSERGASSGCCDLRSNA